MELVKIKVKLSYIFWSYSPVFPVFSSRSSIKSKIFFFRISDVGLSVTITKDGLLDEALIRPHDPSSNENLTPLTVNTSLISWSSILILFVSFSAISINSYFDSVKSFNENSYYVASKEINKKIQRATFNISPAIPLVTLPIEKKYGNFHIIAGSFRFEENSLKMIDLLQKKGFIEARKVGVNRYGLIQIAYNSYDSVEQARAALELLRDSEDENAWLLIKN